MDIQAERRLESAILENVSIYMPDLVCSISIHLDPEDIFSDEQLEDWAESNGYVKEDKNGKH